MNLYEMPKGGHSKYSQLAQAVDPSTNTIVVQDISYFFPAPNYATIGVNNDAEVVYYTGVDTANNALTGCVRGQCDTIPSLWPESTYVYNAIISVHIDNPAENIRLLAGLFQGHGQLINSNFSVF